MTVKPPVLVQFGAGNIGRSLVGQLFATAGWRVVFLDVVDAVIDALNAKQGYRVTVKDALLPGQAEHIDVTGVAGIHLVKNRDAAVQAVADADLVGTSVGAANLPSTCAVIADALGRRDRPLSVMLCENLHNAAILATKTLAAAAGDETVANRVGFVEAAISKMAPSTPPEISRADPLAAWAEAYNTLYLDADAYIGTPPPVFGVAWRSNFSAYVDRKLLLHNFGHAAAAYHGCLAGAKFIWECMENDKVAEETRDCMMETARAVAIVHQDTFTFDENRAWADDLLRRFRNKALGDPVARVGRDLKRKLAPEDRLIGSLRILEKAGLPYPHTARAIAAAMLFHPDAPMREDEGVVALAAKAGPEAVLVEVSGMDKKADAAAIAAITEQYGELANR